MRNLPLLALPIGCFIALLLTHPGAAQDEGEGQGLAATGLGPGVLVLDLVDNADPTRIGELGDRLGVELAYSSEVSADEALVRAEVPDLAAALNLVASDPLVEVAEPELELSALGYPNDPMWDKQWNMQRIGAPSGWRVGAGRGVKVAVIDTGVSAVEDLQGVRLLEGRSFVPGVPSSADDNGHGTHVAGTIAQATHNGKGVAGIAPEVELMPYKVLGRSGSGSSDRIAAAIDDAVDNGAHVINLSLGSPMYSKVIHKAVIQARDAGVIVVAAAGNDGREGVSWPGRAAEAVGVSATNPQDSLSFYSSWGKGVDISAPGGDTRQADGGVLQDTIDGSGGHDYRALQGTSMATPHVAGAAAVLLGLGLSPNEVVSSLMRGAQDLGTPGYDTKFGHGRLDLTASVKDLAWRRNGLRGLMALSLAWTLATLAGLGGARRLVMSLVATVAAGGLLGLSLLPLRPNPVTTLLSHELLAWPALTLGLDYARNPLWLSALWPAVLVFVLGFTRSLGPLVGGICVAVGAGLVQAAVENSLRLPYLGSFSALWLGVNGAVCLLLVLAVVGVQRARR